MRDRRALYRLGLSTLYLPYYDALCLLLGPEWQPYCGLRSFVEQTALYMRGRVTPGAKVTNAKGGESPHNYGCASDWCLFEGNRAVWPPQGDPKWSEYGEAIAKVGLKWGGEWQDNPHNELPIVCSWKHVLVEFNKGSMLAAQQFIEERLTHVVHNKESQV